MNKKTFLLLMLALGLGISNSKAFSADIGLQNAIQPSTEIKTEAKTEAPAANEADLYAQNLGKKLSANWHPISYRGKRNATVLLTIDNDGSFNDIKIQKTSNRKNFDNEIIDAVLKSAPFQPLCDNYLSDSKSIQVTFTYDKPNRKTKPQGGIFVAATSPNGYDEYVAQVESILKEQISPKRCFFNKDTTFEININKSGKLSYVKSKTNFTKRDAIKRDFERKMTFKLQKTQFPKIPESMETSDLTIDYRVLTQRKRMFKNFLSDYVLWGFTTEIDSYCIRKNEDI